MHLDVEVHDGSQVPDTLVDAEGVHQTDGVGEAETGWPRLLGRQRHPPEKLRIGPGGVLGPDADLEAHVLGGRHQPTDLVQDPVAVAPQLASDLLIGDRDRKIHQLHPEPAALGQVFLGHARPDHEPGGKLQIRQGTDGVALLRAHGGDSDLQLRHAQLHEPAGDGELLGDRKGDPGGLLAVPQGRVVDGDADALAGLACH